MSFKRGNLSEMVWLWTYS